MTGSEGQVTNRQSEASPGGAPLGEPHLASASGLPPEPPPPVPAAPPPPPSSAKRAGIIVAVVAGLGVLVVKFVLPLVLVGVAGEVLGGVFGGPFGRLPADVRSGFEQRFDTAVGDTLDGLSDEAKGTRVLALVKGGLPRLDDATLASRLRLTVAALNTTDTATCAAVARAQILATEPSDEDSSKMISGLNDADLRQWFEIALEAVEAQARGAPAARVVTDSEMDSIFTVLIGALSEADTATFGALSSGGTVDDAAMCSAIRALNAATLAQPEADVMLLARYDVSP